MASTGKRRDPLFWAEEIYYLLNEGPAMLGQRGTMAAFVAAMERGGASGSAEHEWVLDDQVGYGKSGILGHNAVARMRELGAVWRQLSGSSRALLAVHYEMRRVPAAVAPYLYAPDGRTSLAGVSLALCSPEERTALSNAAAKLDQMSQGQLAHEGRQYGKLIKGLVARVVEPVKTAHEEWYAARKGEHQEWAAGQAEKAAAA